MRNLKIKKVCNFSIVKNPISWIRVVMLAVYTMPGLREMFWWIPISMNIAYNMSRDKTKSFWNRRSLIASSIIISLSNNHNNNINQANAKCAASAIEIQHISNAVANPDIPGRSVLVNLVSEKKQKSFSGCC